MSVYDSEADHDNPVWPEGLQEYIDSITEMCKADGFVGFAFILAEEPHELKNGDLIMAKMRSRG